MPGGLPGLTPPHHRGYLSKLNFGRNLRIGRVISHDADVQASEPEAEEQARVPGPYANEGGLRDPQPAAPAGSAAPGGDRRFEVTRGGGVPGSAIAGRFRDAPLKPDHEDPGNPEAPS